MKKLIALVLVSACILCIYGCKRTNEAEPTDSTITEGILDGGTDIALDSETKNEESAQGITDEILNGTLDGGADIALDAETEPENDTTVPEIMNGILDGGADIGVDATP